MEKKKKKGECDYPCAKVCFSVLFQCLISDILADLIFWSTYTTLTTYRLTLAKYITKMNFVAYSVEQMTLCWKTEGYQSKYTNWTSDSFFFLFFGKKSFILMLVTRMALLQIIWIVAQKFSKEITFLAETCAASKVKKNKFNFKNLLN